MTKNEGPVRGDPDFYNITPPLHIAEDPANVETGLKTAPLFEKRSVNTLSPIDEFLSNVFAINKIYTKQTVDEEKLSPELSALIVLGYMSAAESYFRSIFRHLLNVDARCQQSQLNKQLRFAAALHHDIEMLPEALLEHQAFSDATAVQQIWKDLAGSNSIPRDLSEGCSEYQKICQIRHCCVHRFGRLGVSNATVMGLMEHKETLEGRFSPSLDGITDIANFLINFIRGFNSSLFHHVLVATVNTQAGDKSNNPYDWIWTWNYNRDRARFVRYYRIFSIKEFNPKSMEAKDVYDSFRKSKKPNR